MRVAVAALAATLLSAVPAVAEEPDASQAALAAEQAPAAPPAEPAGEAAGPPAQPAADPAATASPSPSRGTGTGAAQDGDADGDGRETICGGGQAPACEDTDRPHPGGFIEEELEESGPPPPPPPGGGPPATASARISRFVAAVRRRTHEPAPVSLSDRKLVVENGKVRIEVECLLGSLERTGRLTLILPGGRQEELAGDDFRCDRLGRMTVELDAGSRLAKLLEGRRTVRARLVVRFGGHTLRAPVTLSAPR